VFKTNYADVKGNPGKLWEHVSTTEGQVYNWPASTYIAEPPFFSDFEMTPKAAATGITGARALGVFGDSITTDHISPAGSIKEDGRRANGCWPTACSRRTSTRTARVAATTRS
jgi:aconitate hydratase